MAANRNRPCYNSGMQTDLVFLKLGGSLITDKARARTPRPDVLARLAGEIAQARRETPGLQLLLGHGSGSFGHIEAQKFGTANGVSTGAEWAGFAAVWAAADRLNRLVIDALTTAGVPVLRIAPSSCAMLDDGRLTEFVTEPVRRALESGLVPVVYGDAVFDRTRGGGIASTEMVFGRLARSFHPRRILLAGIERGVFSDYPARQTVIPRIGSSEREGLRERVGGSEHTDVTGGMLSKVLSMLALVGEEKELGVLVFSGEEKGNIRRALLGGDVGGTVLEK
jgi:isopentenyl phosphate kinase